MANRKPLVNVSGVPQALSASDTLVDGSGTPYGTGSGSGTVTSVSLSAPLGGGTVTTTGTLGTSSYTAHGVLLGAGSSALAVTSAGTAGQVLQSNGASADPSWATVGTAGGAMVLISEVVTSGSQATVTVSGFSAGYRDLIIIVRARGDAALNSVVMHLQFNADTGNNYYYAGWISNSAGNNGSYNAAAAAFIVPGEISAASANTGAAGYSIINISNYASGSFQKMVTSENTFWATNNSTGLNQVHFGGIWQNVAAITSAVISLSSGNFVNGSVVSLYGRF